MSFRKASVVISQLIFTAAISVLASFSVHAAGPLPTKISVVGDSITMGFAASCTTGGFGALSCLRDQPNNSWFNGTSTAVLSVHDHYLQLNSAIVANKGGAKSGSELRGGSNNFAVQAGTIVAQTPVPDHVEMLLGGNDICNRDCVDPTHCNDPLYTEAQWRTSVDAGLDRLVAGMPVGSTVRLLGVPPVQLLRAAGLQKTNVNCNNTWANFGICRIATNPNTLNRESLATRLAGITDRQRRYNEILRDEAAAYNTNANGRNPRGIEVVSDYVDQATPSTGTATFGPNDIDSADCFHPSLRGQNNIADTSWSSNLDNPNHR